MYHIADLLHGTSVGFGRLPDLPKDQKKRIQIVALGDVGATVLLGLKLLGGRQIADIGILDLSKENMERLSIEMGQIYDISEQIEMPKVHPMEEDELFDCDVFLFCASKGVPAIGVKGDVRMAQLEANRPIIAYYANKAREKQYRGMVCVISDPVDPLSEAFLEESGLSPAQIQGFGLGVMNARARYFAEQDERFASYLTEGRAYGPHGGDLIIANSVTGYDETLSRELTDLTVGANLKVRDLGYKPYIAPALSSAVLSILLLLSGDWHYSSLYLGDETGGAFLGIKNRLTESGIEYEDLDLPEALFVRIQTAYENLRLMSRGGIDPCSF